MTNINDLINQMCSNGVEYKHLWEMTSWDKRFKEVENYKQIKIDKYHYYLAAELDAILDKSGDVKVLTTSKTDLHTTEELARDNVVDAEIVCVPWGGNPIVQYYKGKFVTGDNRIAQILNPDELNAKYLYYVMNNQLKTIASFYRGSGIKHPSMRDVLNLEIPVPPLPVQEEIVRILDKFTELEQELEQELELRKKQYEHYRDKMLSLSDYDGEVEWTTLGEVCTCVSGGTPSKKNPEFWGGEYPWLGSTVCKNKKSVDEVTDYITDLGKAKTKCMKPNTTLIALVGATIGKTAYLPFESAINQNIAGIYPIDDTKILPDFVYHYSSTYYNRFIELSNGKFAMANMSFVRDLPFPVIDIKEQERIVSVLDKFNSLTEDISEGLPAEIKMRHQQYEYYRDKLLTFDRLERETA